LFIALDIETGGADIEEGGGTLLGDVQGAGFVVAAGCIVVREGRNAGMIIAFLV
jgi:hypothetical protein